MGCRPPRPRAGEPEPSGAAGADAVLPGPGLPDLTGVDFADLEAMPESVLRRALARVLAEDTGPGRFAAFQNAL